MAKNTEDLESFLEREAKAKEALAALVQNPRRPHRKARSIARSVEPSVPRLLGSFTFEEEES